MYQRARQVNVGEGEDKRPLILDYSTMQLKDFTASQQKTAANVYKR